MPSSASPLGFLNALTNGPNPPSAGAGGIVESLTAHITDPSAAHAASAISYAGGVAWADGTTNPAGDVETQLDKILTDLATGDGAGKIRYDGGVAWADGTTNPTATLGAQIDKVLSDLSSLVSGSSKIGSGPISDTSVTIVAGTVYDQLQALANSANSQYNNNASWADASAFPDNSVQAALDEIVTRLASAVGPNGGTRKVGGEAIVNTSATITAGTLLSQLTLLSRASNLQYNPGPAWLGGRTNGATTVQLQLDKIINDLGATASGDDGAERIGATATGDLLTTSVRAQLNELDVNWGKLARANTWSATQHMTGGVTDADAVLHTNFSPTDRKLLWEIRSRVTPAIYSRLYASNDDQAFSITWNCYWNGTQWTADYTAEPAMKYTFDNAGVSVHYRNTTASPWTDATPTSGGGWVTQGNYGPSSIFLGNTVVSGPASIVCPINLENGNLTFSNSANTLTSDTNPPATGGGFNVLKAKNIIKAWGNVSTGGASPVLNNGFNVTSVSYSGGTSSLIVTIASDLANADYAVVATAFNSTAKLLTWNNKAVGSFRISHFDSSTGTQTDLDTGGETITFMVIGEQDS